VGALAVVNALGNVLDREGRVVAGARSPDGTWLDASSFLREPRPTPGVKPGANTTLGVVATDAPLSRGELARVVRVAATALARRIDPVNTPFDGDLVFALSTAREVADVTAAESLALGVAMRDLLEEAITRAVTAAR
jgi:L-aminopeptidase/D-esterase-like protein